MRYGSVAPHARKKPTGLDWVQKLAVGTALGHFLIVLAAGTGAFFVEAFLFTFFLYNDALWMIGMLLVTEAVLAKLALQRQRSPYHFPMGLCSAVSCALGAVAGTWIYDSYGYFALVYSRSRTYENIVPLEKAAAVADAGGLVFADEAHVDVSMSAGYAASDGHVYCAAPVRGMGNSTDVEFWAVGKDCCSSLGDFTCDSAGDNNAHGARIVLSDGGIFRRSSAYQYQQAVEKAEATYGLSSPFEALHVSWIKSEDVAAITALYLEYACGCLFLATLLFALTSAVFVWLVCRSFMQTYVPSFEYTLV